MVVNGLFHQHPLVQLNNFVHCGVETALETSPFVPDSICAVLSPSNQFPS